MFQDAFWLATQEYKYHWLGLISTLMTGIVLGALTGLILLNDGAGLRVNSVLVNQFIVDLLFIGMAPSFATLFMSKPYLSYKEAKQNPYAKRMAVLRTLPISVSVLAFSRILFMLMTLVIMSLAFYGMMAIVLFLYSDGGDFSGVGEFVIFMCVWFGFMLAVGGISPYIEYGADAKWIHILSYVYMALFILFEVALYNLFGIGIVEKSILLIKNIGWPLAAASLLTGAICCYGWKTALQRRLENRDYI